MYFYRLEPSCTIGFWFVNWTQVEISRNVITLRTYSINALCGSRSPPSVLQILLLYFLARFVTVGLSQWRFFVCRSLYSMYCSVTVKSLSWQSCCSLNPLIPKCVTLFHHTRWRRERGFWRPIAPDDHTFSIISSVSTGWAAFGLLHLTFLLQIFFLHGQHRWNFFELNGWIFFEVEGVYCRWTWTLQKVPSSAISVSL